MKVRRVIKIFNSFKEQEEADIKYWQKVSPGKRVEALEKMRINYLIMRYGRIPRLRRVYKFVKQTQG